MDWQRHYTYLTQLLNEGARHTALIAGVTRHGEDIGRWPAAQRRDWNRLNTEQQPRLTALGVKPTRASRARKTAATGSTPTNSSRSPGAGWSGRSSSVIRASRLPCSTSAGRVLWGVFGSGARAGRPA